MKLSQITEKTGYNRALTFTNSNLFGQMYSYTEDGKLENRCRLVEQLAADWQDACRGEFKVEISELYIDADIIKIDSVSKVLTKVSSHEELLNLDHEEVAVKRAICKIRLSGLHDDFSPALAVNFSEKGIEFAAGEDVNICSNFTIFSRENLISTYDKIKGAGGSYTKLPLEEIRQVLKQRMAATMKSFETDMELIKSLEQQTISKSQWNCFLGDQFTKIEKANHFRVARAISALTEDEKRLVVNGRQLARIAVEATKPCHEIYNWNEEEASLWSVINWGTERLKFEQGSDSLTVLRSNRDWVNLIRNYPFSGS